MYEHENPDTDTVDIPEPWALLPTEVVCRREGCNLAYHRHLQECPTCRIERPM